MCSGTAACEALFGIRRRVMHLFTKDLVESLNLSISSAEKISHTLCAYDDILEACIRRKRAPDERLSLVSLNGVSVDGFLQKNGWISPFLVYYLVASLRDRVPELRVNGRPNEAEAQVLRMPSSIAEDTDSACR